MKNSVIYLTGFMTSGKSTVGPILANVLGWNFFDLDKEIENREKMSIVEIFETKGEKYFREVETEVLKELSRNTDIVISLGGGTITSDINLKILNESGKIIYLKVSTDILYHRLKNKIDRPLFRDLTLGQSTEEDFKKKINEILNNRIGYYEKADLVISTDTTRIGITVDILAKKVRALLHEES